jgi:hypothetical protein
MPAAAACLLNYMATAENEQKLRFLAIPENTRNMLPTS